MYLTWIKKEVFCELVSLLFLISNCTENPVCEKGPKILATCQPPGTGSSTQVFSPLLQWAREQNHKESTVLGVVGTQRNCPKRPQPWNGSWYSPAFSSHSHQRRIHGKAGPKWPHQFLNNNELDHQYGPSGIYTHAVIKHCEVQGTQKYKDQ